MIRFVNDESKKLLTLLLCTLLFIITMNTEALANSKFSDLEPVHNWRIISEVHDNGSETCHAIMVPYRTKELRNQINQPLLIVSYKGKDAYTISFSTETMLATGNAVFITIDGFDYALKSMSTDKRAFTYSALQDVHIINALISTNANFIQIKAMGANEELNLHYFTIAGLFDAMKSMKASCK